MHSTGLSGKAGHAQLGDRLGTAKRAQCTPYGVLQNDRIMQRSIDLRAGVLDQIGIASQMVTMTMRIQDSDQAKAQFPQYLQKLSARTLSNARINQEGSLSLTNDEANVARPW